MLVREERLRCDTQPLDPSHIRGGERVPPLDRRSLLADMLPRGCRREMGCRREGEVVEFEVEGVSAVEESETFCADLSVHSCQGWLGEAVECAEVPGFGLRAAGPEAVELVDRFYAWRV